MLRFMFRVFTIFDRALASPDCKKRAALRARYAASLQGESSVDDLLRKLRDPRRRRSRREIRLAVAEIISAQRRGTSTT